MTRSGREKLTLKDRKIHSLANLSQVDGVDKVLSKAEVASRGLTQTRQRRTLKSSLRSRVSL